MLTARFIAFAIGFLSLSLEILWVRLFSFVNASSPQAFAFVLVFYLTGIALGALIGKNYCEENRKLWLFCGIILLLSSISDALSPWIYASSTQTDNQLLLGAMMIFLTASMKAILFPIVHYLGTPSHTSRLGHSISLVYVANIFGATLGPLFTGVVLLSFFTTQQAFLICALLTAFTAAICFVKQSATKLALSSLFTSFALMGVCFTLTPERLLVNIASKQGHMRNIIENEHGIIITYHGGRGGDYVTGGNVYDGRTNLDPVINSNQINRLLILAALHDHPQKVLMIGLSIGTWLKLVTSFPGVQQIDVIEINPGYLKVIQDYPQQNSGLHDPRVHLNIADGRQWLKIHPDNNYDLIVMNTTYYWRNYLSNLLSQEFLQLIKQHLRPGGILTYNSTFSPDVFKTATTVFPHAYLYGSFVVAANFDWRARLLQPEAEEKLAALQLDEKPLYPPNAQATIKAHLTLPPTSFTQVEEHYKKLNRSVEIVTDKNLITEFKYGRHL